MTVEMLCIHMQVRQRAGLVCDKQQQQTLVSPIKITYGSIHTADSMGPVKWCRFGVSEWRSVSDDWCTDIIVAKSLNCG